MDASRKARLLRLWADVLTGPVPVRVLEKELGFIAEETPDALVAKNVAQIDGALRSLGRAEAGRILRHHVRDSTLGMARWAERGPDIAEEADLDDYMHEVAGRVGWLLTDLFALDVPRVGRRKGEMLRLGREFGLGLQTVNVIRGLHSDWERGWVYIPRTFVEAAGADPGEIFQTPRSPALEATVLDRLVSKAERHLEAARSYVLTLPARNHGVRLFCLLPYLFAVRTLALSRGNRSVFREEVKIGRTEVRRIARLSRLLGWSNAWIRSYGGRLAQAGTLPRPREGVP